MTSFDLTTQTQWDDAIELITAAGWTVDSITASTWTDRSILIPDYSASRSMPKYDAVLPVLKNQNIEIYGERVLAINSALHHACVTIRKIHARHFQGYMGDKRKALVRKYGYDTKNAAHLIRLMRMCVEFLNTGEMVVFRENDADYIRDIKSGKYTIEYIRDEANKLFEQAKLIKDTTCPLPDDPDIDVIDKIVIKTYLSAYGLK
jgi:hypothetical protein